MSRVSWKYAYGAIGARAAVGDVVGDVDHVAAAMERQHLHDLVAVGGGRGKLQFERGPRRLRARAGPGSAS